MKRYKIALIAVIVALLGVAIAYAALQATLNITVNKITQSPLTWEVKFTSGTVTATASGTSSTGRSCGTATVTDNSVTVSDTSLSKPDDSCRYQLQVKNTGSIAAKLKSLDPQAPSSTSCTITSATTSVGASMVCGNITYKITTDQDGTVPYKVGQTLAASTGTQTLYLFVTYTGTTLNSSTVTQSNGKFQFVYEQA